MITWRAHNTSYAVSLQSPLTSPHRPELHPSCSTHAVAVADWSLRRRGAPYELGTANGARAPSCNRRPPVDTSA